MSKRRIMTPLHSYLNGPSEGPPTPEQFESYVYFLAAGGFFDAASKLATTLAHWYDTNVQAISSVYAPIMASRLRAQAHVLHGAAMWKARR